MPEARRAFGGRSWGSRAVVLQLLIPTMSYRSVVLLIPLLFLVLGACSEREEDVVLPDPEAVEVWFEGKADVQLDGRRLVIEASMDPEHLARGGKLWQRATPYFYLFNVHIRQVLTDYPSIQGVDVIVHGESRDTLARVSLNSRSLNTYQWDHGVAYTSRAQSQGTERPIFVAELLDWADDHVDEVYVAD